jgi:hypothetical protein
MNCVRFAKRGVGANDCDLSGFAGCGRQGGGPIFALKYLRVVKCLAGFGSSPALARRGWPVLPSGWFVRFWGGFPGGDGGGELRRLELRVFELRVGFCAELEEEGVGSAELAVVAGFVAILEVEDSRVVGQVFEDHGGSGGGDFARRIQAGHFQVEAGFLDAPDAHLLPTGDGHGFDDGGFGVGAGVELGLEAGEEIYEAVL